MPQNFSVQINTFIKQCLLNTILYLFTPSTNTQNISSMASILYQLKLKYHQPQSQYRPFNDFQLFISDNLQRIGKHFLSTMVSFSLIKFSQIHSNRNISLAYKKLQQQLCTKLKINNKKSLYKMFGKFSYQFMHHQNNSQTLLVQLQLAYLFYKHLEFAKSQRQFKNYHIISLDGNQNIEKVINLNHPKQTKQTHLALSDNLKFQSKSCNPTLQKLQEKQYTNFDINNQLKPSNKLIEQPNQQLFTFQLTNKDLQSKEIDYCQRFFLDVTRSLSILPSPQTQLTYIWQHLKWQGFQTFSQPYMNQNHQWVYTARIKFPENYSSEEYMQRTQKSKNKRKAKQLACMDLLKSLYLQYPEVWMIYKHVKQQKKLIITPTEQPKDNDQLSLITNRSNYKIDRQKVSKLLKHKKIDIVEFMQKISAKSQLNTILQQLPGRIISPKLQKKIVQGKWLVPVRIQYRTQDQIEKFAPPKIYQKNVIFRNAKIAQEQAYMQALIDLYSQNPELFEKIQSIKMAKNINDVEKKLPLLRELQQQ